MSLHALKQTIKQELANEYESIELSSLIAILLEHITGWNQIQQVLHKDEALDANQQTALLEAVADLKKGKPIHYITNKAWFMGNELMVNENVLIQK